MTTEPAPTLGRPCPRHGVRAKSTACDGTFGQLGAAVRHPLDGADRSPCRPESSRTERTEANCQHLRRDAHGFNIRSRSLVGPLDAVTCAFAKRARRSR